METRAPAIASRERNKNTETEKKKTKMQIKALLLLTRDRGDESAGHCENHEHRRVQEETGQREAGTHQALQRVHLADRHHPAYEDLPATPTRNEREGGGGLVLSLSLS